MRKYQLEVLETIAPAGQYNNLDVLETTALASAGQYNNLDVLETTAVASHYDFQFNNAQVNMTCPETRS